MFAVFASKDNSSYLTHTAQALSAGPSPKITVALALYIPEVNRILNFIVMVMFTATGSEIIVRSLIESI